MAIIEITSLDHERVQVFGTLTEAQLRNRLEPEKGIFIVESVTKMQKSIKICSKNIINLEK